MTEDELRKAMKDYENELPDESKLKEWAKATKLDEARIKAIYGEVIGDPDPWGTPAPRRG